MSRRITWLVLVPIMVLSAHASTSAQESSRVEELPPERAHRSNDRKMELWDARTGPHLRGVNIFLTRVFPLLDRSYRGDGPIGPPYRQSDFDRLSALGANVVTISMPGLFTVDPPWEVDHDVQGTLDDLLAMIERAGMFAVITARTGPGRNEFGFHSAAWSRGLDFSDHSLWQTAAAQQAWIDMWRYTAARYRDAPNVVGYYLMVEPNASDVVVGLEREEFFSRHTGSLLDWNVLYPDIIVAIREEDLHTPIIVDSDGWAACGWLEHHPIAEDRKTVYSFHQYLPLPFTIGPLADHIFGGRYVEYGGLSDLGGEGDLEDFDSSFFDDLFAPADDFVANRDANVAVTELGLVRWVPGASTFMRDQLEELESRGFNHTVWLWNAEFELWEGVTDPLGLQFGPDRASDRDRAAEDLLDVLTEFWSRNVARPDAS